MKPCPCIFASHEVLPYIEYAYHAFYFCNRIVGGIVSFVCLGGKVYKVTILFDSVVCRIEFVANIFNVFCIIEVDSFIPNIFFFTKAKFSSSRFTSFILSEFGDRMCAIILVARFSARI